MTRAHRIHVEPLSRELLAGVLRAPEADGEDEDEDSREGVQPVRARLDLGVVPWFSDERPLRGLAGFIDWRRSGALSRLVRSGFCAGNAAESVLLPGGHGMPVERLVFVGLGESAAFNLGRVDAAAERIVEIASKLSARDVLFSMPDWLPERPVVEAMFSAIVDRLRRRVVGRSPVVAAAAEPAGEGEEEPAVVTPSDAPTPLWANAQWWMVAEPRNLSRLRRLLEGPPRAAAES